LACAAAGCATKPGYDYSAFRESRPKSILVLPPLNDSPDVNATYSMYAQTTLPLAESGYYVLPVTLVDEAFRQNGLTAPADIQQVPLKKLREIFGADAALYIKVTHYGTKYMIISSETRVSAEAKLVDLAAAPPCGRARDGLQRGRRQQFGGGAWACSSRRSSPDRRHPQQPRPPDRRHHRRPPALRRPAQRHPVRPALTQVLANRGRPLSTGVGLRPLG
jgi:hypothetical protein